MEKEQKSELLKTIQNQQDEIEKYRKKLGEVVTAYKSLQQEKSALESSVQSLSVLPKRADVPSALDGIQSSSEIAGDGNSLQESVDTLTTSLATLSAAKAKMESSYQADRKKMMSERDEAMQKLKNEVEKLSKQLMQAESQMQENRSRLIIEQHERQKEEQDHQIMLQQLQKLVSEERSMKEQFELQVEEMKINHKVDLESMQVSGNSETRSKEKEVLELKSKLAFAEESMKAPSDLVKDLQTELAKAKVDHRMSLQLEEIKLIELERRTVQETKQAEARIAQLEGKLAELSDLTGRYEKYRASDQEMIAKLRECVGQLDLENNAHARVANSGTRIHGEEAFDIGEVAELVERITQLKVALKTANEHSPNPVDISELFGRTLTSVNEESLHLKCRAKYDDLQNEFEKYKLRAQSVLKTKQESGRSMQQLQTLQGQLAELRERLRSGRKEAEQNESRSSEQRQSLMLRIASLEQSHRATVDGLLASAEASRLEFEREVKRHRERTVALLAEKEREIQVLRVGSAEPSMHETEVGVGGREGSREGSRESYEMAASQLMQRSNSLGGETLLHFVEEQARREAELNALRQRVRELELNIRQNEQEKSFELEMKQTELEAAQERVRQAERVKSRENANIEYLKNVVYQFLSCQSVTGRRQMLNAIMIILQFSPVEQEKSVKCLFGSSGWWLSS